MAHSALSRLALLATDRSNLHSASPFTALPPGQSKYLAQTLLIVGASLLLISQPAWAHHAIGGTTPTNFIEGFLSGLAHPIIGLDHFAFVVAIGLLAALTTGGLVLPITFILATLAGTGLHLHGFDVPIAEAVVALSVLAIGGILAFQQALPPLGGAVLVAIAGLFHGYAYGESIVGAEMTPLVAYLTGFAFIQLLVAIGVFAGARVLQAQAASRSPFQMAGFTIVGMGLAFVATVALG